MDRSKPSRQFRVLGLVQPFFFFFLGGGGGGIAVGGTGIGLSRFVYHALSLLVCSHCVSKGWWLSGVHIHDLSLHACM